MSIRGGEKPRTTLTFVTTQPADEYNLGKTVSEKMGDGWLTVEKRDKRFGTLTRKVVNPATASHSADVVLKLSAGNADDSMADSIDDDFNLSWTPEKKERGHEAV